MDRRLDDLHTSDFPGTPGRLGGHVVFRRQPVIIFSRSSCGTVTLRDVTERHVPQCVSTYRVLPRQCDNGNLSGIPDVTDRKTELEVTKFSIYRNRTD